MYIIYRDFITMLIIALPSHQFPHLVELLLVRYSNARLRLFVVILQDLHSLQRFYHHWCITLYHHTHLVELLLVRYSNACLRLFVVIITRFTLFTEILLQC